MFKKILGAVLGVLLIAGVASAEVKDIVVDEFRNMSVVELGESGTFVNGWNYTQDDVDAINSMNPWVGLYIREGGQCVFMVTMFGIYPVYSTLVDCDMVFAEEYDYDVIQWIMSEGSWLMANSEKLTLEDAMHNLYKFVNSQYNEDQRP